MRILFFEDSACENFSPIALMRPVFDLLCGQFSQQERTLQVLQPAEWGVQIREYLADAWSEQCPGVSINDPLWLTREATLLVNARWLGAPEELPRFAADPDAVGMSGETVVCLLVDPAEASLLTTENFGDGLEQIARSRPQVQAEGKLLNHPWDLIAHNADQLEADFALPDSRRLADPGDLTILGPTRQVRVDATALIDPFVVLDARKGPITIGAHAHIQSFTRIEGPCHIGEETQIFRGLIRSGTSIGPVCRVGGEIEECILHGYMNKYHEGFLGHSYVCPWVNLGALTTNSDLKTDYSDVKVFLNGDMVDTGQMKVGCFIGDHTKTALASIFNTGSSIGVMSVILPGGELLPRHVPSFSLVYNGDLTDGWELDRCLDIARTAMSRRRQELTPATERLLRYLAKRTQSERGAAIFRHQELRQQRQEQNSTLHWK